MSDRLNNSYSASQIKFIYRTKKLKEKISDLSYYMEMTVRYTYLIYKNHYNIHALHSNLNGYADRIKEIKQKLEGFLGD